MGEFAFKSLCVLVIAIVAFLAFKVGSFWGSNEEIILLEPSDSIHVDFPDQSNHAAAVAENQLNTDFIKNYPIDFSCSSTFGDVKVELSNFVFNGNAQLNGLLGIQIEYELNLIADNDTTDYVSILRFYLEDGTPLMSNNINYSFNGYSAIETVVNKGKSYIKAFIPYLAIEKFNNTGINKTMNNLFGWHLRYDANVLYHNAYSNTYTPVFLSKKNDFKIKLPPDYESHYNNYCNATITKIPDEVIRQDTETELEHKHTDNKSSLRIGIVSFFIATITAVLVWILARWFKRKEWNPKYHGGRLEIIKRHGKYKVIAYSTTDNDKKVVWNSSDRSVQRASWKGSVIELYCGLGHCIMLYGPNNFDEQ